MKKNNKKTKSFRIEKKLLKKLEYISVNEFRDFTGQVTFILDKFVEEYEKDNNLTNNKDYKDFIEKE